MAVDNRRREDNIAHIKQETLIGVMEKRNALSFALNDREQRLRDAEAELLATTVEKNALLERVV